MEEPLIGDLLALLSADASPARRAARDERRSRALRSLLSDREFEALPDELLDLLFGDRLVLWTDDRANVARAINVANYVWGLNALPVPADRGWLVWNLANLRNNLPEGPAMRFLEAVEQLSLFCSGASWYTDLRAGRVLRSLSPVRPFPPPSGPTVITVPAFNDPDVLAELLADLRANAELFDWGDVPVVVFDASNDPERAAAIRDLVSSLRTGRLCGVYVGREEAHPPTLPGTAAFTSAYAPLVPDPTGMFNPSVGGNLNVCFSYFGPEVTVANFDHDVLPSVDVPAAALDVFATSSVLPRGDLWRVEVPSADSATRRLPVDFMSAFGLRNPGAVFAVTGAEVTEGDDESYKWLRLEDGPSDGAEFAVAHIAGVQDHSARFLLNSVLDRGVSLSGARPAPFVPAHPVLPVAAARSKLITTTLTVRRHDVGAQSLGFVGTSVRVHDFLTGSFLRVFGGRPLYWAPVYLTHNRRYGLRGEKRYGEYLLNEEYMRVFLTLAERLEAQGSVSSWGDLARNWRETVRDAPLDDMIGEFLTDARALRARLAWARVDATYVAAADSIGATFRLDSGASECRRFHLERIAAEAERITAHLTHRSLVNKLGGAAGVERYRAALAHGGFPEVR